MLFKDTGAMKGSEQEPFPQTRGLYQPKTAIGL